jgi:hypothetical protein
MQVGAWQWPWMLRNWTAGGAYSGSLLGRGGCTAGSRWQTATTATQRLADLTHQWRWPARARRFAIDQGACRPPSRCRSWCGSSGRPRRGCSRTRPRRTWARRTPWAWPCLPSNGQLLGRGGCPNRGQSLVHCNHGDSMTGRVDSPPQLNCVRSWNGASALCSWNQKRHFMRYVRNLSWSGVFWFLSRSVNMWWQQLCPPV